MRVIGYRAFQATADTIHPVLGPVGVSASAWTPGLNHAACVGGSCHGPLPHRPGDAGSTCGFWALHSLTAVHARFINHGFSFAVVVGSGQVTLHQHGWRAERAQIMALLRTHPDQDLGPWAEAYGVPCIDAFVAPAVAPGAPHTLSAYLARGLQEIPRLDPEKVSRWVSEFGLAAFDPRADWPMVSGSSPSDGADNWQFSGYSVSGNTFGPLPKRRFWQWR